jgi:sugar phosphate isomerase/epimerase
VAAIRKLGEAGALYHFHAKDTYVDPYNTAVDGTLDARPYQDIPHRSWTFRSVGYGHDTKTWKDIVSALRTVGYDGVLSIEHEDAMASIDEGFRKAVETLKEAVLREQPAAPWWT